MIHLRVVQAVQQMNRARAGCREADADFAGELRVRARHERRHLLVAHLDEVDPALRALERAHDAVDAVAGITVNAINAPGRESFDEKIAVLDQPY